MYGPSGVRDKREPEILRREERLTIPSKGYLILVNTSVDDGDVSLLKLSWSGGNDPSRQGDDNSVQSGLAEHVVRWL
jgi:hypothetical protein